MRKLLTAFVFSIVLISCSHKPPLKHAPTAQEVRQALSEILKTKTKKKPRYRLSFPLLNKYLPLVLLVFLVFVLLYLFLKLRSGANTRVIAENRKKTANKVKQNLISKPEKDPHFQELLKQAREAYGAGNLNQSLRLLHLASVYYLYQKDGKKVRLQRSNRELVRDIALEDDKKHVFTELFLLSEAVTFGHKNTDKNDLKEMLNRFEEAFKI